MPGIPAAAGEDGATPFRPLLAIDTSSAQGAIALYDGRSLAFRSWAAERSHTTTLLTEIHHLLDAASVDVRELAAVGIAIGPGTFTGLRVGFGVAKGFHLANGTPLIGLPTLEATALPYAACGGPVVATIGAGRGRLVWAHYEGGSAGPRETRPPRNGTVAELAEELAAYRSCIVAGELDEAQAGALAEIEAAILPPAALRVRHPAAFAALLWRRWRAGRIDDAALLEPVYLSR